MPMKEFLVPSLIQQDRLRLLILDLFDLDLLLSSAKKNRLHPNPTGFIQHANLPGANSPDPANPKSTKTPSLLTFRIYSQ
jgi:hypothetical protein